VPGFYLELMLDLREVDVEKVAPAPADWTDCEHRWLIDPRTDHVPF
jgi:hypothetical protein